MNEIYILLDGTKYQYHNYLLFILQFYFILFLTFNIYDIRIIALYFGKNRRSFETWGFEIINAQIKKSLENVMYNYFIKENYIYYTIY